MEARQWIALVGLVACGACSQPAADDDGSPATDGPGGAGASAAASSAGGSGAAGTGATASNAAGSSAAGASAAGASAAGSSAAGADAAGSSAAGASAAGSSALGDAGAPAAGAPAERPPASSLSLETMMESPNVEPWFNIYRPTDLDATGAPLPVIVWANGGCYRSDFTWAPLYERWAAAGFFVLALTEGPEGALVQSTVEDQRGLIDWAIEQAAAGPYAGKLDLDRIVAAGNSCGGITALGLASDDDRVAAVFVLSGSSAFFGANAMVIGGITVPVGYVVGGGEDIASANATADYEALADGIPAMIVSRSSGDHMTVSTDTMILPQVAEIAVYWMDLALYRTRAAAESLMSPTVCAGCDQGVWTRKSKHLDSLQQ
jgi:predicted dienelactone hydrolase